MAAILALLPRRSSTAPAYRSMVRGPVVSAPPTDAPAVTLPSLPHVSPWPALLGLAPWIVGKYVLCPLRWHALSESGRSRRWHLRAYAESELLGLVTPSHAGADLWRIHRLQAAGMRRSCSVAEVGLDRPVGPNRP